MKINIDSFLEENKGLLVDLTNKFYLDTPKFSRADLLQEASLAATRALEKFDPDRGTKITTYVYSAAKRSIRDFVRKNKHDLYVSPHQQVKEYKAKKAAEVDIKPSPDSGGQPDVCEKFGFHRSPMAVRLDVGRKGDRDSRGNLAAAIPSGDPSVLDSMIKEERDGILLEEVNALPDREQEVIKARFFDGRSLAEIARTQNVSRQRIDQISRRAIERLKDSVERRLYN